MPGDQGPPEVLSSSPSTPPSAFRTQPSKPKLQRSLEPGHFQGVPVHWSVLQGRPPAWCATTAVGLGVVVAQAHASFKAQKKISSRAVRWRPAAKCPGVSSHIPHMRCVWVLTQQMQLWAMCTTSRPRPVNSRPFGGGGGEAASEDATLAQGVVVAQAGLRSGGGGGLAQGLDGWLC